MKFSPCIIFSRYQYSKHQQHLELLRRKIKEIMIDLIIPKDDTAHKNFHQANNVKHISAHIKQIAVSVGHSDTILNNNGNFICHRNRLYLFILLIIAS